MIPGARLEERFETLSKSSSGGMGTVFRARDRQSGAEVALKLLQGHNAIDIERFTREATILAGLLHPAIVRYVAHGVTRSGEHYLAMEWLEGEDLSVRLLHRGLSMHESLVLVRRAADALAFAHAQGLVHRDLKPSNLFLCEGEVEKVKIVDFGIARLGLEATRLTRTGVMLGTPGYMAPEQIQGPPSHDPRADVFALGCVLFECLTGRPAFEGQSAMSVLAKILLQDVPRVRSLRPGVPEPLDDLVARMMARDPEARPPDAAAVAGEIDRLGDLSALPGGTPAVGLGSRALVEVGRAPSSLTMSEQRLVSVVLAGDHELTGPRDTGRPVDAGRRSSALHAARPDVAELRDAIEPHGGTLHALAGGSFLVTLWGPGGAVDPAVQAGRCALALKSRFPALPVCVVTGRGLVSARVVEGEMIERGVLALRAARTPAVHVDDVSAGMLRATFRIDREPPSAPGDGRTPAPSARLGAHLLRGERAPAESIPILLGQPTPCVGRARELSILEGVFSGCVAESVASTVLVVGPEGSGKSRLRRELLDIVQRRGDRVEILTGAGDSMSAGSPYRMIADALCRAAGIRGSEPLETRRSKLRARVSRHLDPSAAPRVVAFLGELAGTPFPDAGDAALRAARDSARIMGDAMRAAWEDWLAAECGAQPLLLVLEDMHFGDAATVSLIDSTLRNLRDLPLMVLVLARPEVHDRFPSLWSEREVQLIRLGPLSRKASEQIVRAGLGTSAADNLVSRLADRAEGNPFYLEELVRAAYAGRADLLPDSVLATVEARLDAEGATGKRVLRAASVFGDRFWHGGLVALLGGESSDCDVTACLATLTAHELIAPASARSPTADPRFVFCHALVREAAYAMLTDDDRALGHRLAGKWLEERDLADAVTLAEHFRRGRDPARSAYWYRRAAEHALEASDLASAVDRAARGIACGAAGEELGLLRLIQAEAGVWRGDFAAAEADGRAATALLQPGSVPWFRAVTQSVTAAGKLGVFERIEEQAELAAGAPAVAGARSAQLVCLVECASYLLFGGRYAAFEALLARLRRAVPNPAVLDAQVAAQIRQLYAFRASYAGDPGAALESFEAALGSLETAGDRRNACVVRSNLGFIFAELGDFESAEEALRGAIEGAERMGLDDVATAAMQNLGHALAYLRRLDEARLYEQRAIDAFHRLGDLRMEGISRTYLAKIGLFAATPAQAEREAQVAAELLRVAPPLRAAALAVQARSLLEQDKPDEALPIAQEAHAILESLGEIEEGEAMVRVVYAEALRAKGARREFEQAVKVARDRLLERAAKISDAAWRERFLTAVPENARTLVLWGVAARSAGAP